MPHIIFDLDSRGKKIENYVQTNTASALIFGGGATVKDLKLINHKIEA